MSNEVLKGYQAVEPDPQHRQAMRLMKGTATRQERYIPDLQELVGVIEHLRSMGCVVVLTMGVWDLFHIGHAEYMEKGKLAAAEKYPDAEQVILIVGVDSDALTKERKGPKRPIVPETERCGIIGHIRSVDIVTLETSLGFLHKHIPHDVRVISTSTKDLTADAETTRYCAELVNLPPQAETSTSARIRTLVIDGGLEALKRMKTGLEKLIAEVENELSA
jgi:D-beta-D-heptose 7-phosphate kinase/D-beta-D-heptose 1-phosphate adenosyltransferase